MFELNQRFNDLIMFQLHHHSWNYPDLSLDSLLNNVPLICTRVQERYSIRGPHQHTSKYGKMKRQKKNETKKI